MVTIQEKIKTFQDFNSKMKSKTKKSENPKVGIVICTYNQEKLLEKCLNSLKERTQYKNYKVFFVDDSGKGEIAKNIKKKFPWVNVTANKKNLGFAGAHNVGMKKSIKEYNPDYLLLLNDDTEIIQKDWLTEMVKVGNSDDKIGVLGCRIVYPDGSLQNIGGYLKKWELVKELELNGEKKEVFEVDHVMGAFMLIKRKVINEIGFLDENYNPYLLEDTDYCLSAKKAGFKVVSVGFVKIIHKKGKTLKSLESADKLFIRFRNDIYFSRKNLHGWNKFFRIFIYLPFVAVFKKKKDEDSLSLKNFKFREKFLRNLGLYCKSFWKRKVR
jgi:GT2 family glycosyltransferase